MNKRSSLHAGLDVSKEPIETVLANGAAGCEDTIACARPPAVAGRPTAEG